MNPSDNPQLSLILQRFDSAWAQGGVPPAITAYLPVDADAARVDRQPLLIELVMIDLERRWRSQVSLLQTVAIADGSLPLHPLVENYLRRFPELGSLDDLPTELIAQEYRVRMQWGDRPMHSEYARRFPAQSSKLTLALSNVDRETAIEATLDGHSDGWSPDARYSPPPT